MATLPKGQGVIPLPPFKAWLASNIPAVYDNTMTYYEELVALIKYLQDTVLPAVNDNASAITTISNAVEQLQKYVDDYFTNLDVQEEINKKLDVLVDNGTLSELLLPVVQTYLEPVIEGQNEQIEDLNTRVVNQNNYINSVNARVDSIASLTQGSTTGDAELMDIRVGYDGVTYASAGEAVRHGDRTNAENIYNPFNLSFVRGSINASTGEESTSATRLRTTPIDKNIVKIYGSNGYHFALYLYNITTKEYVGVWYNGNIQQSLSFSSDTLYIKDLQDLYDIRVVAGRPNFNEQITADEGSNIIFYSSLPKVNRNDIDYLLENTITNFSPNFQQGSINVTTGEETSRNDRCRSVMLPASTTNISVRNSYRYMLYGYTNDGVFEGCYNANLNTFSSTTYVFNETLDVTKITNYGEHQFKIIACPPESVATITPDQANTNILVEYNFTHEDHKIVENYKNNKTISIHEQTSCVIDNYQSLTHDVDTGICMVTHNGAYELWTFKTSNDDGSNYGVCDKYSYDPNTNTLTFITEIQHNLGHVNSVSYCEETDTLICGNGSSDYELSGAIYIIEGAYSKESLLRSDAIVIPFTNYGFKVNAVWGDANFDQYDIVYVITNDSHDIYKLQLGKFSNNLGQGTITSGAVQFNGTYQILNHWTWGNIKKDYASAVQGATFCSNKLVWGYGHNMGRISFRYAKLNTDNTAEFGGVNYHGYSHTGEPSSWYPCGVTTFKDKLVSVSSRTFNLIDLNASI